MADTTFKGSLKTDSSSVQGKLCIGWLANNRIQNKTSKVLIENITEFHSVNASTHGVPNQFYGETIESLADQATDFTHMLIVKIGIVDARILEIIVRWYKNDYNGESLIGHILDKDDNYYELHPQMVFLDLQWYRNLDNQQIGDWEKIEWHCTQPIRSEDNLHGGGYTPTWVKQGSEQRKYTGRCYGWNLIKQALESKNGAAVWPKHLRELYVYTYPETPDWNNKFLQWIYRYQENIEVYYAANTEDLRVETRYPKGTKFLNEKYSEQQTLITTAGGLSAAFAAYRYFGWALKDNPLNIMIWDKSKISLSISKHVYNNWNSDTSWKEFIVDHVERNNLYPLIRGRHKLDEMDSFLQSHSDFKQWYKEIFQKYTDITYYGIDMYDIDLVKRIMKDKLWNHLPENEMVKVYFNVSNIYHYKYNSLLCDYNFRKLMRKQFLDNVRDIQDKYPNFTIQLAGGLPFVESNDVLEIFPWYKNDE